MAACGPVLGWRSRVSLVRVEPGATRAAKGPEEVLTAVDQPIEESAEVVLMRAQVREWLGLNFAARGDPAFREAVIDAGYAAPSWSPEWHGRGLPMSLSRVVAEEFAAAGAPGSGQDASNLWANTILAFASDDMKNRFLRRLLLGELSMCLLYSEPGAGSDLAAVQTRADRDGDEWVVNGQKIWTSGAQEADYGMLIARTNWDVPKHRGITFFYLPMRQPGIEVRPIRQATGDARFNEVFITDARVPHANIVGEVNDGWRVLQTALMYERMVLGGTGSRARPSRPAGNGSPGADQGAADLLSETAGYRMPDTELVALARSRGTPSDPLMRQALAHLYCLRMVNTWNGVRARAELQQGSSSPAASLGKLAMSRILHTAARLEGLILGMEASLDGPELPRASEHNYSQLNAYFTSIGGGTDQVQRNIIGERILGLPKEPEVDKDIPFRDVLRAPAIRQFETTDRTRG